MSKDDLKLFFGFFITILVIVIGGILLFSKDASQNTTVLPNEKLVADTKNATGPKNAKVTLVEFSDYECPACGAVHPAVKQLLEKYQDKIRFVYRHFPLPQHTDARLAAYASEAAGQQDKFWQMHDKLFENQKSLKKEDILKYAKELGLDQNKFQKDWESEAIKQQVEKDLALGTEIGINQTPTFFLNGEKLSPFSTEEIEKVITEAYK